MYDGKPIMDGRNDSDLATPGRSGQEEQLRQLEDADKTCLHFSGGDEFGGPIRLRHIQRRYPEAYGELDRLREEVVGRYIREIKRQSFIPTKKYHSEVYMYRDAQHRTRMLDRLDGCAPQYPGRLLLWTDEGDHLHVVHDCPYSNGQCRCYFGKSEDFRRELRSPMRRTKHVSELDEIDWTNVFLYFLLSKWKSDSQVWIDGRHQRLPSSFEVVRWRDLQEQSRQILDREEEGTGHQFGQSQSNREDDRESISSGIQRTGEKRSLSEGGGRGGKKTKFQRISETVQTLLSTYYVLPANHLKDVLVYNSVCDVLFDPSNDKVYASACDLFTRRFNVLKFKDMYDTYYDKKCVFYANSLDPFEYYHNMEDSIKFVDALLKYQYNDDVDLIRELLSNIRDWFNLEGWTGNKKMNCVCVIGPPNSGKNYFWDMLAALAYNVGHIGRVNNKTNQFALQECYGRRLIMGNEISMEEGAKEDFKKLCEGTAFNIRVKYQGDKIFTRAPVCLISNRLLDICCDAHFRGIRLTTLYWKQCDLLKDSNKKPYPLCLYNLFDMYNVQY